MSAPYCNQCGVEIDEADNFCAECGTSLAGADVGGSTVDVDADGGRETIERMSVADWNERAETPAAVTGTGNIDSVGDALRTAWSFLTDHPVTF